MCHNNVLYSDTLCSLRGEFLHSQLPSSQSEYSTHWENILCFIWFYSIPKLYVCFKSSRRYFIMICVLSIFSMLSIMLRCFDDVQWVMFWWTLKYDLWKWEWDMIYENVDEIEKRNMFYKFDEVLRIPCNVLWHMKVIWCWKQVYESESKMIS